MSRKKTATVHAGRETSDSNAGFEASRPPPSTLAAQLAQSHADPAHAPADGGATLSQLLDEIINHPDALEPDWRSNRKLIAVVAEAGLRAPFSQDPFTQHANNVETSLEVIARTINKTPEVLFNTEPGSFDRPLYFDLTLQLLSLLHSKSVPAVHTRCRELLASFASRASISPQFWTFLSPLVGLLHGCAVDALDALATSPARVDATLPSAATRSLVAPDDAQLITVSHGTQIVVTERSHLFLVVITIVAALESSLVSEEHYHDALAVRVGHRNLVLMKRVVVALKAVPSSQRTAQGGHMSLITLRSCLELAQNRCKQAKRNSDGQFFICAFATILSLADFQPTRAWQLLLKDSMRFVAELAKSSRILKKVAKSHLTEDLRYLVTDILPLLDESNVSFYESWDNCSSSAVIINSTTDSDSGRPVKRTRRDVGAVDSRTENATPDAIRQLSQLVGPSDQNDLAKLSEAVEKQFNILSGNDQARVCKIVSGMAASVRQHDPPPSSSPFATSVSKHQPKSIISAVDASLLLDETTAALAYRILRVASKSEAFTASRELRVELLTAIGRLVLSTPIGSHADITSELGKACLQALRSSTREIRIAASNIIPRFLRHDDRIEERLCDRNRGILMEYLRQMAEAPEIYLQETVIHSLGQLARVALDHELHLAILKLCEYLGHQNTLLYSLADLELRQTLAHYGLQLGDILRPFWSTIAITAVRGLPSKPQMAQRLAELLGKDMNQLLAMTQPNTIPWLVLWKRTDILDRVVAARCPDATVWNTVMNTKILSPTLALLLSQQSSNPHALISDSLAYISSDLKNEDIGNLLKPHANDIAFELFKAAGNEDGDAKRRVLDGFHTLTSIIEKKSTPKSSLSTPKDITSMFLEKAMLGILASFVDSIESPTTSMIEKRRLLRGVREFIAAAGASVANTIPQIRACLQTAMNSQGLTDEAFNAWMTLLPALDESPELSNVVQQTFSFMVQNWHHLSAGLQQETHETIASLVKAQGALIQDIVHMLPSLKNIPVFAKIDSQLSRLRSKMAQSKMVAAFVQRCREENALVVEQTLQELEDYLIVQQHWIHESALADVPSPDLTNLLRALLDVCGKYNQDEPSIAALAAKCLGIAGCIDPTRVEAVREKRDLIILSNFEEADESVDFVIFFLDTTLVKAFHSVSNPRAQGFLAYVMQELLRFCGFNKETTNPYRVQGTQGEETFAKWNKMPESTRSTLTPFLSSHYVLKAMNKPTSSNQQYPVYKPGISHAHWLWTFTSDLLHRATGVNSKMIFQLMVRIIKGFDTSISSFVLPYIVLDVILGGTVKDAKDIKTELLKVLEVPTKGMSAYDQDQLKLCSENVFQVLDYLSKWLQKRKLQWAYMTSVAVRANKKLSEASEQQEEALFASVESIFSSVPADIISSRAIECNSYTRALVHWESHIRQQKTTVVFPEGSNPQDRLYMRLQEIYSQIDEPDCIEGITTHLQFVDPDLQAMEHQRAGRWEVACSHYENVLSEKPDDIPTHVDLLNCLEKAGRYQFVLRHAEALEFGMRSHPHIESVVAEALWFGASAGWLGDADQLVPLHSSFQTFNGGLAHVMGNWITKPDRQAFADGIERLRTHVAAELTVARTSSTQACHDQLLKLHALYEAELIAGVGKSSLLPGHNFLESNKRDSQPIERTLQKRLNVLGTSLTDKQYLLSIRRAIMRGGREWDQNDKVKAESWLTSARLARKAGNMKLAWDGVLEANLFADHSATIEQARLLWGSGEQRKAIQNLQSAIAFNAFELNEDVNMADVSMSTHATAATSADKQPQENILAARAHLLLAKWLDQAGQTQSTILNAQYQQAAREYHRWEKGLYYLGRFYNKLLDSEKNIAPAKQSYKYLSGETAKLVVENYLRSLIFGCKYLSQTLPKLLTLWLDFGAEASRTIDKAVQDDVRQMAHDIRPRMLETINKQVKKYGDKIASYLLYTALPQMITRVGHSNPKVYDVLAGIILRVASSHPQQALWPLLAIKKASQRDRAGRGLGLLSKLRERGKSVRHENNTVDLKSLVMQGEKLTDQLLHACEVKLDSRTSTVSLSRELGFIMRIVPSPLVVPFEKHLTASLPTVNDSVALKVHRAFPMSREVVTIASFSDEVTVLSSLQRPRKITLRGSDGQKYSLLCKPNDDLRKDQRLMEFNAMINRLLKKDAESSKRRLYIRTYAVTPLNEACGIIEWVDGLKPIRDILLNSYRSKGIKVDYMLLKDLLNDACRSDNPDGYKIFSESIIPMYKPVLHEWFTDMFPAPDAWFAARLRYVRSCAVSSMVGHALGLGDRHGENVLLEENSGGVFHVDFNCLFDKGLTFEKPELVPFRLTHNMVDAFGGYGIEGPWRRAAEFAMGVMRQNEDALLTILETFVYDPTADFVGTRKRPVKGVPETPKDVLESVRSKVRGLMRGENVPLSVQGHVDALVRQATDPKNLCAMYIGWCAFL